MSVIERLNTWLDYKHDKNVEIAKMLDFSTQNVSKLKQGKLQLSQRVVILIATNYPELSLEWLFRGVGNMLKSDIPSGEIIQRAGIAKENDTDYGINWRDKYNQLKGEVDLLRELQGIGKKEDKGNGTCG